MKLAPLFAVASLLVLPPCLMAQDEIGSSSSRIVSATGTVIVKQAPTFMRMTIQFKETAKDLSSALKNLKDRRDAAKSQLLKFGAQESSFREGDPGLSAEDPRMANMMARATGKKKKKETASKATVTGTLSCQWALPAGNIDETLQFVQTTKEKVQAANLAGQSDQKKVSAEEQEEIEEMEMMQQRFGNSPEVKPGEPRFLFLATISAGEQQKARAAAFKKAKQKAEQLATAAGKTLGKLHSVHSNSDGNYNMNFMSYQRYPMDDEGSAEDQADDVDDEEVGKSPVFAKVRFVFSVSANFDVKD